MPDHSQGAQRASSRKIRSLLISIFAALVVVTGVTASAPEAHAATRKVVIVVGPVGSATSSYKDSANKLADLARSYGASVKKVYSPYATWGRVRDAAVGANLLIYLGHGNGWPSTHYPYSTATKNGMGLNSSYGNGNSNTKYYGQDYMLRLDLASHSVVMLNRLCYASGNNEWGEGNPTKSTAIKRVDNYGYPFIKAGAQAVFASGITGMSYVIKGLFRATAATTMASLFWTDPNKTISYRFSFTSTKLLNVSARMDPYAPSRYYRSVIGRLQQTVGNWRAGA
ncbi:MAG TPA: hypothetical protein VFQ75_03675 [Candidatus Limnocylindrales bacterium]|nr:hypothetical protein [Candidatus Limnocylindrales bacterium]